MSKNTTNTETVTEAIAAKSMSTDTASTMAAPLPTAGGSYTRLPDGTLVKSNSTDNQPAPLGKE